MTDHEARRITSEQFEMELLAIRNGANLSIVEHGEAVADDVRAVWHAAEVALGILKPSYIPKREAPLTDARQLVDRFPEDGA